MPTDNQRISQHIDDTRKAQELGFPTVASALDALDVLMEQTRQEAKKTQRVNVDDIDFGKAPTQTDLHPDAETNRLELLAFRTRHNMSNNQLQEWSGLAHKAIKRMIAGHAEVPDNFVIAMRLFDEGLTPAPREVKDLDRTAIVQRIHKTLGENTRDFAGLSGQPVLSIRAWCRASGASNIKPVPFVALIGTLAQRLNDDNRAKIDWPAGFTVPGGDA